MTYKSLYRTYRPHSFETVVGQKHIVLTLQNALKANKLSHAYLFCGPRGTGKTTVAKLLAKSVNCLNPEQAPCNECEHCQSIQNGTHPDVIEIDAASNNGVDEIRDLIEKVKYAPIQSKYKVYIVDEVHMLSQGAFNALLKTLEEPPPHVIFILATTEPHKVLPTIISRCQRYDFVRVNQRDIQMRIEEVLTQEKISFDVEATRLISQLADGGVRDALSILEQVIAYSGTHLTAQHVNDIYGIATTQDKLKVLDAIIDEDVANLMVQIEAITKKNIDIRRLTNDLMEILKEAIVFAYTADAHLLARLSAEEADHLNRIPPILILSMIEDLMDTAEKYRSASNIHAYFEIGLLKLLSRVADGNATVQARNQVYAKETQASPTVQTEMQEKVQEPKLNPSPTIKENTLVNVAETMHEELLLQVEPEAESNQTAAEPIQASVVLEEAFLLSLLSAGDKPYRVQLSEGWEKLKTFKLDAQFASQAHHLLQAKPLAANEDFLLVSIRGDAFTVDDMNHPENAEAYRQLLENTFGHAMQLYVVDETTANQLVQTFKDLLGRNEAPKPAILQREKKKKTKKMDINPTKEVMNLFGEENVEIL